MSESTHTMFRPPAEAHSVLIRVADGCPHNRCFFCAMYQGVPYREFDRETLAQRIAQAARQHPQARRIFLADGDVLALDHTMLEFLLSAVRHAFPAAPRVNAYASGRSLSAKSPAQLEQLHALGLHTLYLGLESGSSAVLRSMGKGSSVADMVESCIRAQHAGLCISAMVLIGLGGQARSAQHVAETITVLNQMQPRLLSCLRLMVLPGTVLMERIHTGKFTMLTAAEAVRELRALLAGLNLHRTVFRADHASNILPLSGRLPKDKELLLADLDELLACDVLDTTGPGPAPARL